jgi:hypothetical protein
MDDDNVNILSENKKALLEDGRETGLEVNTEETSVYGCVSPPSCKTKITVY